MSAASKFYGKYRGTVMNNVDPMLIGRVQVQVPDVLGVAISSWAMPCVPVAGKHSGAFFAAPSRRGRLGRVRAGRPGLPDLDRRASGVAGGGAGDGARGAAADAQHRLPDDRAELAHRHGRTGRGHHHLLGTDRVADEPAHHDHARPASSSPTAGATITVAGPVVDINNGALTVT